MSLRALHNAPLGSVYVVGPLEFYITNNPHDFHNKGRIALPNDAWNILASKFIEVTAGWEESPFDFGDCGYLFPEPVLDIGVELVGEPVQDECCSLIDNSIF